MWVADSGDGKVYAYDMQSKERDPGRDIETVRIPRRCRQQAPWGESGRTRKLCGSWTWPGKLFAYDMIRQPPTTWRRSWSNSGGARPSRSSLDLGHIRESDGGPRTITGYSGPLMG